MDHDISTLADLEEIREVARRYCRGVDRLDGELMRSAYWPDAVDDHGTYVGNAWTFVDRVMASHGRWRSTMHCIFNHTIELVPGHAAATGEIYNVSYLFAADGSTMSTWWGRYLDRYECRDGQWRIAHRVCVHEGDRRDDRVPMEIASDRFRSGTFDRSTPGRPIGP